MALRNHQSNFQEEIHQNEQSIRYQTYQTKPAYIKELNEVLFFINIAIFAVLTVLSTYLYICLNVSILLAFAFGAVSGAIGLKLLHLGIRRAIRKRKRKDQ